MDDELIAIFLEEAGELIDSTAQALQDWSDSPENLDILRLLQRDLHTLKGGARLADVPALGDLSHELENLFEGLTEQRFSVNDTLSDLLFRCHDRLASMVDALEAGEPPRPAPDLISEIHAYVDGTDSATSSAAAPAEPPEEPEALPEMTVDEEASSEPAATPEPEQEQDEHIADLSHLDPELVGIFLEEAYDLVNSTGSALHTWSEDPSNRQVAAELQREVHTLKGSARMAGVEVIGELSHRLEDLFEKVATGQLEASENMLDLLFACHDRLAEMVEQVATQKPCPPANELIQQVQAIVRGEPLPTAPAAPEASESPSEKPEQAEPATPVRESTEATPDTTDYAGDEALAEMFLDEGREIHQDIGDLLAHWREEPEELSSLSRLLQELQTLKSGARLSDVDAIADLAQAWADALNQLVDGERDRQPVLALSEQAENTLKDMLDALEKGTQPEPAKELIAELNQSGEGEPEAKAPKAPAEPAPEAEKPQPEKTAKPAPSPSKTPSKPKPSKPAARNGKGQAASQETIRVSAPLLDDLVNLAGETSITRGRLEQQSSDFSYTLDEMAATIERLREQLRRMDIETEAQILFRAEQEHGPNYGDDFDPLEMDRYSSIQQLSRALTESTSDLADLRETLSERVRDTETLLVQQSRINTELQEGLMKTRMIPFTSMVPRLRRIVRQISGELHKKVHFDIRNAEGEMDRNILERMVAPLEHMLRNAIDHGIENPEERKQAGKPESGEVVLSLALSLIHI